MVTIISPPPVSPPPGQTTIQIAPGQAGLSEHVADATAWMDNSFPDLRADDRAHTLQWPRSPIVWLCKSASKRIRVLSDNS